MIDLSKKKEKVVLVAVALEEEDKAKSSLEELEELVKTAGAEVVGTVIQNRDAIHPGTYVGSGKLDEQKMACVGNGSRRYRLRR